MTIVPDYRGHRIEIAPTAVDDSCFIQRFGCGGCLPTGSVELVTRYKLSDQLAEGDAHT
jgi:hypothetical protein